MTSPHLFIRYNIPSGRYSGDVIRSILEGKGSVCSFRKYTI